MAGIFFTDEKIFLCGYSQHKHKITGIGGKKQNNELPYETALRETLEEIFEFDNIPFELLNELNASLTFNNIIGSKKYTNFIMSLHDLELILNIVNKYHLKSRVYKTLPKNLGELIYQREYVNNIEISKLYFFPLKENPNFDFSLNLDISRYLKTLN
jgi:hypothetical protein